MEKTIIKPVRIQMSRQHRQMLPNSLPVVYVGRPSVWGNPFKLNEKTTRKRIVQQFEVYARERALEEPGWLEPLKGKNLSCWCGLSEPCHADILLELANK